MKNLLSVLLVFVMSFAALFAAAPQFVDFQNSPPELVRFDSSFGSDAGTGVVNSNDRSYVAALFDASSLAQIGQPAQFGRQAENAGLWLGGVRVHTGVDRGTPLNLVVRVWDSSVSTYDDAILTGKGHGESATFQFLDPQSKPFTISDIAISGFRGFDITQSAVVPEPPQLLLGGLGLGLLGLVCLSGKGCKAGQQPVSFGQRLAIT